MQPTASDPTGGNGVQRAGDPAWHGLLPGVGRLLRYERSWLRGDLIAGCTVAAYLVPQVMAYAEVAGLPPVTGLWAIIGSLAVYALLGSSRQLSVGPESTTALMTAAAIGPLASGDAPRYAALAATLALMVGALCVLAWLFRLGFLAELLSRPVLIGYLAGVAVIMMISQLGKVTGIPVDGAGTAVGELSSWLSHLDRLNWSTLTVSGLVVALLVTGTRWFPRAPVPLIVMLLAAASVAALDLQGRGLAVVGLVPGGVPLPSAPGLAAADLAALLLPALGVTVVGYTDNVLTGRAFATRNGYTIDPNQELLALGAANAVAGLMRGFPVSSSGSRTVIGDSLGSRSQLYSLVALVAVVLTLVAGRGVLATFPVAALGGLVVWAAARLVDIGEFRRLGRFRRSELLLACATTAGVLTFDILYGVLVAVGLSLIDLLHRVARPHDGILGYVPGLAGMHDVDDYPVTRQVPGLVVYRYDSPLFFANAEDFKRRALAAVDTAETPTEWLLINAEANIQVDLTALDALDDLRTQLEQRGVVTAVARLKTEVAADLRRAGFLDRIGPDLVFPTLPTAVTAYARWYQERHGTPPTGLP
jgi:high affinity sulfate transporter 1